LIGWLISVRFACFELNITYDPEGQRGWLVDLFNSFVENLGVKHF